MLVVVHSNHIRYLRLKLIKSDLDFIVGLMIRLVKITYNS